MKKIKNLKTEKTIELTKESMKKVKGGDDSPANTNYNSARSNRNRG